MDLPCGRIAYFARYGCKSQRTGSRKWPWRRIWLVSEINMKNVIVPPDNVSINHTHLMHGCYSMIIASVNIGRVSSIGRRDHRRSNEADRVRFAGEWYAFSLRSRQTARREPAARP